MRQRIAEPTTESRPLVWFKTDEREEARHNDPEKIRQRGQDMLANGQLQAVGALETGEVLYGTGRVLSGRDAGMETMKVNVYPASLTETQKKLLRAAENIHRNELTGNQKHLLCVDLLECNPGWEMKDLAEELHLARSMVTKLLSPLKCISEAQKALADGTITISDCYEISRVPAEKQGELLRLKEAGASRDGLAEHVRKHRKATTPQVRVKRIVCPLPSGVSIAVTGQRLSLDDLIEALGDAQKEAKRGREQKLDVKTWESVMRDKSRAQ